MQNILFLTIDEIVRINELHIALFGGRHGIRDFALLDSAVQRPQASFGGKFVYQEIYTMAAVYAHGIIKNHPFIDGNKRTGMAAALVFLNANDYEVTLSNDDVYDIGIDLATSEISYEVLAEIFKDHIFFSGEVG